MAVLIYTENWDGKFKKLSFELVSYGAKVAEMLNTQAIVLSIGEVGDEELKSLGKYGASRVISLGGDKVKTFDSQVFTDLIAKTAGEVNANTLIFANNNSGKALAPRLSVRLKAGIASGVSKLPVAIDPFTLFKRSYSGNTFTNLVIKTEKRIITLAQNSFELVEKSTDAQIEKRTADIDMSLKKVVVEDVQKQTGKLLITDADVVVSGGRGMKSADNWGPLLELAELLGGATACSRPVSDEGWRPHDEHTGQTGKIIAPNLYIAVGISGATQHIAGVSSSKYIVAINNDKDAPIFENAQYGIIGDAAKVLPKLVEAAKAAKGK